MYRFFILLVVDYWGSPRSNMSKNNSINEWLQTILICNLYWWRKFSQFRYVAICHPLNHRILASSYSVRKRVVFYTLPVMLISVLINIPKILETKVIATQKRQQRLVTVIKYILKLLKIMTEKQLYLYKIIRINNY